MSPAIRPKARQLARRDRDIGVRRTDRRWRGMIAAGCVLVAGCAGIATGCIATVQPRATVAVDAPALVEIQPGVWVVSDYDDSVFYSDGYYWRWNSGVWYRSSVH